MIERYTPDDMRELWDGVSKYRAWLEVELAATAAWERLGEVPEGTAERLRAAFAKRPMDQDFVDRVAEIEAHTRHDIVAFTRAITERVGDDGRFVHLGLTSTDVVDTAQNLLLVRALDVVLDAVTALRDALLAKALRYKHTPCIGRTHGVHAEPMTFGLKFLNFYANTLRDISRIERAQQTVGVAMLSGSVGTYAHVPPEVEADVAKQLNLSVDPVTNQTVARDRHAELMSALAILGTTLERVSVEIRHLQRTEVREAQEGFAKGQTGSSSMPHKKNPIASENIAGLARLLRSNLSASFDNVALWHERDISHSSVERVILPDTTTLAVYTTRRLTNVVSNLVVYPEAMQKNLDLLRGLIYSQRVLHKLIDQGMSREDAYALVQRHSLKAWESETPLKELLRQDANSPLDEAELDEAFDPAWYLRYVDTVYARFGV